MLSASILPTLRLCSVSRKHYSKGKMSSRVAMRFARKARELISLPPAEFASMTKPTCVDGVWRPPYLRPRKVARLRKIAAIEGLEFPMPLPPYPRQQIRWKPNKGRKWERERDARYVLSLGPGFVRRWPPLTLPVAWAFPRLLQGIENRGQHEEDARTGRRTSSSSA